MDGPGKPEKGAREAYEWPCIFYHDAESPGVQGVHQRPCFQRSLQLFTSLSVLVVGQNRTLQLLGSIGQCESTTVSGSDIERFGPCSAVIMRVN